MKKNITLIVCIAMFSVTFTMALFMYAKYISSINHNLTINVRKPNYTVVFHSNNGSDTTVSQSHTYGTSKQLTANSFNNSGYDFKYWTTETDGTGDVYDDEEDVLNLTSTDGDTIDLYAQWAPNFIFLGNPSSWTNQDVTLSLSLPEGNYSDYEYSYDGGTTWESNYSKTFSSNQDVHIKVRDHNGYVSDDIVVPITKIDKTDPTITYATSTEYNADHTEKQVETLIAYLGENKSITNGLTAADDLSGIAASWPKCYRLGSEISSTNVFTSAGRYEITCKAQDNAGNETTETREVLIRWPLAGEYVVKKIESNNITIPVGHSSLDSPDGLYKDNASTGANVGLPFASKYYYAGANVDNYINFAGTTFRILNVATNDDIKLLGDVSDTKVRWGPSYESSNRKIYLSNTYNTWSTKWWPRGQIYNNETGESKYKVFTAKENAHVDLATFYAGRFNKADAIDISYTVYLEQTSGVNLGNDDSPSFEGYSAYPNVSDYLKANKAHDAVANIDDSQSTALFGLLGKNKRQIFRENSWIDMTADQWTMNSKNLTSTDNDFWVIDTAGGANIQSRTFYYEQQYRVVFYLKSDTILSGSGTSLDPYNVEEDWAWFDSYQTVQ